MYILQNYMAHTRPPIITVVGHIDHGKSKLQHALRNMDIQAAEAGNITQHIGAYELNAQYEGMPRRATIIDTPGHEAFSHIRKHGLEIADIALLVISSEEGWKEQTKEAHRLIEKVNLPYIVVFTKIDTDRANIERAKQSVLQNNILLEGLGGSVPWTAVSSVTNEGIADLVELIFLTTDVYEIIEDRKDGSVGILIEADIDPKIGIAGTVIVLQSALETNKYVRIGGSIAPLRIMKDDWGNTKTSVTPSTPVRIIGFDNIPPIGEPVFLYETKKEALEDAKKIRPIRNRNNEIGHKGRNIHLVLRSDTASGLSSIEHAITGVAVEGISFIIVKKEVGNITEEDMRLALAQDGGQVVGFHTSADQRARQFAERNDMTVNIFSTIYELIDWATVTSQEKKEVYEETNPTGSATVIRIFEEQPAQGIYIIGAQIIKGKFVVNQNIITRRNGTAVGRFTIESIEQRSTTQEEVSGEKTQFAMRIKGNSAIMVQDTILALPNMMKNSV